MMQASPVLESPKTLMGARGMSVTSLSLSIHPARLKIVYEAPFMCACMLRYLVCVLAGFALKQTLCM